MTFLLKTIIIMRKECELMRIFDYSILAKRSWDSEIIGLVAQIHEYKGRQELLKCRRMSITSGTKPVKNKRVLL